MMTEKAKVVAVRGERALLETQRQSACGSCAVNKACGTGVIARYWSARPLRVEAHNEIGARVGEEVLVAVEDRFLVRGSLLVYLLPLLALFAGGLLGSVVGGWLQPSTGGFELAGQEAGAREGWTIGLALLGLWLGFVGARHWARHLGGRHGLPVIVARPGSVTGSTTESAGAGDSDGDTGGTSSLQAVPVRWHTPFSQGGDGS